MELATVAFVSLVLCGIEDVYAAESLATLTTRVRVVEQDLRAWKFSSIETETKLMNKFKVWEESLKEELTSTFLPSLINPLVKQAINKIMTDEYIGNEMRGQVLSEVQSLKTRVQITKRQLQALTKDLRCVQRERDNYRESAGKERSELTKDIRALQQQVNQTVVRARLLRSELNQTIDDLLETNQNLAGITQDFTTLNTSCVLIEKEIQSYREDLQEMQGNVSTDIRSLNIQLNHTIRDLFDSNQTLTGLTQDLETLNTSCVVTEREIKSYREGLQEMQIKLPSDIQSVNMQLTQTISDLFDSNQTLAGLTQDLRTLNTSCVVTEKEIKSYREDLQEMQRNVSTDIRSVNIQLTQTISDLFDSNQTLAGLTQDLRTLNTSCVVTEKEIKSYREDLQEMQRNVSTDIRSVNMQLNQTISDLFDSKQTLAGLKQDLRTLNTSCCGTRKGIKEPSTTTYPGTTEGESFNKNLSRN
ncbi:adventurous-gliding motility protein Z-like [Haliotis asinina]|uniref:adventurous-gliding motility protein Z-like n=1 Tax=Haliotis asinina TaxID=109174 RepID=UPI0035320C42